MAMPIPSSGYELNLEEYWQLIRRRRWVIVFCALSLGAFSWFFTWLNQPPPLFSSTASVKIERTTSMAGLLLRELAFTTVDDMSTQLALIESYALMERVAQRLGLVPKDLSSEEIRTSPKHMGEILNLRDAISAEQEGASAIINISAVSLDAGFARDLAQAVAEEYRAFNIEEKNKRIFEAKRFIQRQLVVVGERLRKAEEAVRDYRKQHDLPTAGTASDVATKLVADLEQSYRAAVARLNDLKFALGQLRERVQRGWDYQAVTVTGAVSPYFDELNKRLVALAMKRTELSTNYTDEHPQIVEIREQAADILASMVGELDRQVDLTQQRIRDMQANIADTERRYQGLPEQVLALQRLERTVRVNEELYGLLEKKLQEVLIQESEKIAEVSLVRPALVSNARINPVKTTQTAIAGFILGLVLGLIIALVLEAMDTSVGTIDEVEAFLQVPVMGFIAHLSHDEAAELFAGVEGMGTSGSELERQIRLISHFAPRSTFAEAYRTLRTNLLFGQGEGPVSGVFMFTSSTIKEGKSTVATNLAIVLAQQGSRVLLVDGDMRKPMLHKVFGIKRDPGLNECLLGQTTWKEAKRTVADIMMGEIGVDRIMMTPGLDHLDLLPAGRAAGNPTELLASPAMHALLAEAKQEYDMVIMDISPVLHTTDPSALARSVDGIVLVYHIGAVSRGVLKRSKTSLEAVGGRVLGIVLNGVRGEATADYRRYKMDRYYAHAYGDEEKKVGVVARFARRLRRWRKRLFGSPPSIGPGGPGGRRHGA